MAYSLRGDRNIEWGWVERYLPLGSGRVLEIGPAPKKPKPSIVAVSRGWTVTAVGLQPPWDYDHERFNFIEGDFNDVMLNQKYDWILNISTIEHFGLAGRYGVEQDDPDADLHGMRKAHILLKPDGRMLLTCPIGQDNVMEWRHRVYGSERLPKLLSGYRVLVDEYYAKFAGEDAFKPTDRQTAYLVQPTLNPSYYALGLFLLGTK